MMDMDMDQDMVISGMKPGEVTITPGMDMAAMPYRRTLVDTPGLRTCTAASVRALAITNTTWSTTKRRRDGRRHDAPKEMLQWLHLYDGYGHLRRPLLFCKG